MNLYRVLTVVREYHGCKDVTFVWFYEAERPPRPYAELIENYQPDPKEGGCWGNMSYAEDYIRELFSLDEARQLKDYLDREYGHEGTTTITEEHLPIPREPLAAATTSTC